MSSICSPHCPRTMEWSRTARSIRLQRASRTRISARARRRTRRQGSWPLVAVEAPGQIDPQLSVEKVATTEPHARRGHDEGRAEQGSWRSWLSRRQAKIDPQLSVEEVATKPSEPSEDEFDLLASLPRAINSPAKSLTHSNIGGARRRTRRPGFRPLVAVEAPGQIDPLSVEEVATKGQTIGTFKR